MDSDDREERKCTEETKPPPTILQIAKKQNNSTKMAPKTIRNHRNDAGRVSLDTRGVHKPEGKPEQPHKVAKRVPKKSNVPIG